jgi:flagellar assembly protein FliH
MTRSPVLRGAPAAAVTVLYPDAVVVDAGQLRSIKDQAEADGYQAGYHAGVEAARVEAQTAAEHTRNEVRCALGALTSATTRATGELQREQRRLEIAACHLAFDMAEAVLARELVLATNPGRDAVVRALAEIPADEHVTVRLHPADAALLGQPDVLPKGTTVVSDPSVGRGSCLLDLGAATVDARIETALQRIRQVLDDATADR